MQTVGNWFEAHDLMSANAGVWLVWSVAMVLLILVFAWIELVSRYWCAYNRNRTRENRGILILTFFAPITVPAIYLMTAIIKRVN